MAGIEKQRLMTEVLFCIISMDSIESPVLQDKQKTYDSKNTERIRQWKADKKPQTESGSIAPCMKIVLSAPNTNVSGVFSSVP